MPTRLCVVLPDRIHNTYGLEIISDNEELVEKFRDLCMGKLMYNAVGNRLGTFFQGGHCDKTWKYFEFLRSEDKDADLILLLAMEIAGELKLELEIGE